MNGDCYDRYLCRVQEFRESLRIISQVRVMQVAHNVWVTLAPYASLVPEQDSYRSSQGR